MTSSVKGPLVISVLDLLMTMRWSLQADALDLMLPSAEVHQGETNIRLVMDFLEAELGAQTSSHSPSIPGAGEPVCLCGTKTREETVFQACVVAGIVS